MEIVQSELHTTEIVGIELMDPELLLSVCDAGYARGRCMGGYQSSKQCITAIMGKEKPRLVMLEDLCITETYREYTAKLSC